VNSRAPLCWLLFVAAEAVATAAVSEAAPQHSMGTGASRTRPVGSHRHAWSSF